MIVATAGHVDHGKTLLVKALTGIDTDRLPEEKKRNLTIDLGFAFLPVPNNTPIGFIDVPGHERFIKNMLCGVSSIDFALFVIAADDGPMPQTEEHLQILNLLGIKNGALVITKIDRVASDKVEQVNQKFRILAKNTSLEKIPYFPVSALTGEGIEDLKEKLLNVAQTFQSKPITGHFRLPVDRSFTVTGSGLVVTGT
ncbi:MAG: selenocysteine-specific translation elongation factor, partial [Rhodospirillales bacterium]